MRKRGISPLIASVLLIVFVIVLFVIITTWVRQGALEPSMTQAEEKLATALDCINTKIDVVGVCVNDDKELEVTVDNMGDTALTGLNIRLIGNEVSPIAEITEKTPLFGRIDEETPGEATDITYTVADYGEVSTWRVDIYPIIGRGVCREAVETFSSVSACS